MIKAISCFDIGFHAYMQMLVDAKTFPCLQSCGRRCSTGSSVITPYLGHVMLGQEGEVFPSLFFEPSRRWGTTDCTALVSKGHHVRLLLETLYYTLCCLDLSLMVSDLPMWQPVGMSPPQPMGLFWTSQTWWSVQSNLHDSGHFPLFS